MDVEPIFLTHYHISILANYHIKKAPLLLQGKKPSQIQCGSGVHFLTHYHISTLANYHIKKAPLLLQGERPSQKPILKYVKIDSWSILRRQAL